MGSNVGQRLPSQSKFIATQPTQPSTATGLPVAVAQPTLHVETQQPSMQDPVQHIRPNEISPPAASSTTGADPRSERALVEQFVSPQSDTPATSLEACPVPDQHSDSQSDAARQTYPTQSLMNTQASSLPSEEQGIYQDPSQLDPSRTDGKNDPDLQAEDQRLSTSPKLPDVARMSTFGVDFFSAPSMSSQPPTIPEENTQLGSATGVGSSVVESSSLYGTDATNMSSNRAPLEYSSHIQASQVPGEHHLAAQANAASSGNGPPLVSHDTEDIGDVSSESITDDANSGDREATYPKTRQYDRSKEEDAAPQQGLLTKPDLRALPPLRTPSPQKQNFPPPEKQLTSSSVISSGIGRDITPTEPLVPRRPEQSPSEYEASPIYRQNTLNTDTSSPVKESDKLSQEILRTLSPVGPSPITNKPIITAKQPSSAARSSSYTLSDYDSYWADEVPKPSAAGAPQVPSVPLSKKTADPTTALPTQVNPASLDHEDDASRATNTGTLEKVDPASSSIRRRFSWEADDGLGASRAKHAPPPAPAPTPIVTLPTDREKDSLQSESNQALGPQRDVPNQPGNLTISHQVSAASTARPMYDQQAPEPPSPVSVKSQRVGPEHQADQSLSSAQNDGETPRSTSTEQRDGPIPPVESQQIPHAEAAKRPALATFREIMNSSTSTERTLKFDESRGVFASMDSGLGTWLATLKLQHPEHASATASFGNASAEPVPQNPSPGGAAGGAMPQQAPAQQPYYRQYLDASPTANRTPSTGKAKPGGFSLPSQSSTSSAFGHSSDKIGTKGKEFMQSAGKVGKGLFSKGKSKLRGTGEKVFH